MKLTGVLPPVKTEKVQVKRSEGSARTEGATAAQSDRVQLSAGSQEVQRMRELLDQTPDVRLDRVQALREQIARGEYTVDPYRLADKMMETLLSDGLE
ncbi:MAG: flagellar biosynthesis anti-sigma factor FlgM [Thermodesulfobacteriota bacterium]